jgi:hypothetical protein
MPSLLAWLDHSEDDQRRMRELVALFTQEDSRDELGIGAVRDAFSDLLFPGASVLQTRTRYLMFVPWIFREAEQRRMSGPALRGWAEVRERWLIPALRRGGDQRGLIGRIAGPGVKILPSTIYWTALQTYGIARYGGSLEQALRVMRTQTDEADELAERHFSLWHPTLPPPPKGFFEFSSMTFQLSTAEASWLAERIADSVGESMLGQLVLRRLRPDTGSAPWGNQFVSELSGDVQEALEHARLFALAMHGAALVYNLLVARRARVLNLEGAEAWIESYVTRLDEWAKECVRETAWSRWDRQEFWSLARSGNPNILEPTRRWVDSWLDLVVQGRTIGAASDQGIWAMVGGRERSIKRNKSRLANDRLLAMWRGASGTAILDYRWSSVRPQVIDLLDGLEAGDASS